MVEAKMSARRSILNLVILIKYIDFLSQMIQIFIPSDPAYYEDHLRCLLTNINIIVTTANFTALFSHHLFSIFRTLA